MTNGPLTWNRPTSAQGGLPIVPECKIVYLTARAFNLQNGKDEKPHKTIGTKCWSRL